MRRTTYPYFCSRYCSARCASPHFCSAVMTGRSVFPLLDRLYSTRGGTSAHSFGTINAEDLKRAHTLIESGRSRGKIVLEGF